MIPYLLIAGGAYLLIDSLGRDKKSYDPAEVGLPTKGYRGYKRGKDRFKRGGGIAEIGDSANVKSINKTGVIMKIEGDKYTLKFVDGSKGEYLKEDLTFISEID